MRSWTKLMRSTVVSILCNLETSDLKVPMMRSPRSLFDSYDRRAVLRMGAAGLIGLAAPRRLIAADRLRINVVNTSGNTNLMIASLLKQEGMFDQLELV